MAEPRLIKKYPNRRLYDTELSKYVTLSHVRELVVNGVDIKVVDAVSEEDITRQILMQIINEQEGGETPLFSTRLLAEFIRMYKDAMPSVFGAFMEKSLELYSKQQEAYRKQMHTALGQDPFSAFSRLTEQHLALWKEMQESLFKASGMDGDTPEKDRSRSEKR